MLLQTQLRRRAVFKPGQFQAQVRLVFHKNQILSGYVTKLLTVLQARRQTVATLAIMRANIANIDKHLGSKTTRSTFSTRCNYLS
jgi:hypothetical protein